MTEILMIAAPRATSTLMLTLVLILRRLGLGGFDDRLKSRVTSSRAFNGEQCL